MLVPLRLINSFTELSFGGWLYTSIVKKDDDATLKDLKRRIEIAPPPPPRTILVTDTVETWKKEDPTFNENQEATRNEFSTSSVFAALRTNLEENHSFGLPEGYIRPPEPSDEAMTKPSKNKKKKGNKKLKERVEHINEAGERSEIRTRGEMLRLTTQSFISNRGGNEEELINFEHQGAM